MYNLDFFKDIASIVSYSLLKIYLLNPFSNDAFNKINKDIEKQLKL